MGKLLYFNTVVGTFYIVKETDGSYHPYYDEHDLGSYETLVDAIEGIAYDSSLMLTHPEMGDPLDPSDLGIPDDIGGWSPV
jgi:hypothetical protein